MPISKRDATATSWLTGRIRVPARLRALGFAPSIAAVVLLVIVLSAVFAPWIVPHDPAAIDTVNRLKPASAEHIWGTDNYGRDLFSRVLVGGQVSLMLGALATVLSCLIGLVLGLIAGFFRLADMVIMRIMDALMAIPSILLAIALVALNGASVRSVVMAIVVAELPRVVRLVRAVVLSAREEPYVEAAITLGTSFPRILWFHLMPNTFAPLIVQATFVYASAILVEAILSFLGAGVSSEVPTWGNIMAEGRQFFLLNPMLIFWPALLLSLCILSINLLGDTARDLLDPRLKKREG